MGRLRPTRNGHSIFECASALQKSLRRGLVDEAMFWAVELELSNYGEYMWRRLRVTASEDVGIASPDTAVRVRVLYENWRELRKEKAKSERLMIAQAILEVATAPKSRMVDHLNIVAFTDHDEEAAHHPVPDWAYDVHTQKGRGMGRGMEHFFTESVQLYPLGESPIHEVLVRADTGEDPWEGKARHLKVSGKETAPKGEGTQQQTAMLPESEGE